MLGMIIKPCMLELSLGCEIGMLTTPSSLAEEHEEIMGSLRNSTRFQDRTGKAVKELLEVLEPHFEKEEKVAMPILGSLSKLVSGEHISNLREIADSQNALLQEYENMFHEHLILKQFIGRAKKAAKRDGHEEVSDLLDALAHHARVEEEVLYPSALLAGTLAKCLLPDQTIQSVV